jgi:hypothetical protein
MLETYRTKKRMCAGIPNKKIVQCATVPSEEQAAAGLTQMQRSQLKMEPQWFQVCISYSTYAELKRLHALAS